LLPTSPPRFILEIDVGKPLSAVVADDKTDGLFLDGPGRWKAVVPSLGQTKAPALIARIVFDIDICKALSETVPLRIQSAKSAITRNHIRDAFLNRPVLAVPVRVSVDGCH
jgi:hypothetical protein